MVDVLSRGPRLKLSVLEHGRRLLLGSEGMEAAGQNRTCVDEGRSWD